MAKCTMENCPLKDAVLVICNLEVCPYKTVEKQSIDEMPYKEWLEKRQFIL